MRALLMILLTGLFFVACTEEKPGYYEGDNYICFTKQGTRLYAQDTIINLGSKSVGNETYPYSSKRIDTVYIRVRVIGDISKAARPVKFEQYTIEGTTAVDAVPGVNYVAFDDSRVKDLMVVPADSVEVNIPIIVLFDQNSAGQYFSRVLNFRLKETDNFELASKTYYRTPYRGKLMINQQTN